MYVGKIDYRNLEIYEMAHQLVLHIYNICKLLPEIEEDNLRDQLCRATTGLPLNIAEGSGTASPRAFLTYCTYCYRSCMECEAALRLCKDLGYLNLDQYKDTNAKFEKFICKLYRFMQYLEQQVGGKKDRGFYGRRYMHYVDQDMTERSNSDGN